MGLRSCGRRALRSGSMGLLGSLLLGRRAARGGITSVAGNLSGLGLACLFLWSRSDTSIGSRAFAGARGRAALRFGTAVIYGAGSRNWPDGGLVGGLFIISLTTGGLTVRSRSGCFRGTGPGADAAGATIEAGPVVPAVGDALVVSIVNNGRIHAAHSSVIGKMPALPAAAVKSASTIAKAVIHSAIEANGGSPIAGIKRVEAIQKPQ